MVFCINWLLLACVILKFHLFIYFLLFISGCAGSSLLPGLFSSHGDWGPFSNCSARASHHAGFSCCKAQALGWSTFALISHANKVMLKILQARFQQYVNRELPDVQAGFRRGRGTRDQIANIHWIMEKARELQKNIYFCFIDCQSLWLCGSQ